MGIEALLKKFVNSKPQAGLAGIWTDEHKLIEAARQVKNMGFKNFETLSPFPLHGIDEAMGIPRSNIPWVTFIFGTLGFAFGLWFTWWASAVNYPINIGGKPMWSLAAFIPVIFECTILFAALSSVAALIVKCGLPQVDPPVIDPALTSHKFAIFVAQDQGGFDAAKLERMFKDLGAETVKRTEF